MPKYQNTADTGNTIDQAAKTFYQVMRKRFCKSECVVRRREGVITIHQVATAAGVSVSSVSNALNDTGRLSDETRKRVKDAAATLGFRPNGIARGLVSSRSLSVGLLTNDTSGGVSLPLMAGVSQALADFNVSVFLCSTDGDPASAENYLNALLEKRVDGIIAAGNRIDRRLPISLDDVPVPVVYAYAKGPEGSPVLVPDDAQGARLAVDHLRALGRRRLVHVTGPENFAAARIRARSFHDAAGEGSEVLFGFWSEAWGHEAVQRMWSGSARPDGIICGNDHIGRGVVDALRERGVSVPVDVAVTGFDNSEVLAAATRPPLTTVDMNLKQLGREAGLLVMAMADGKTVEPGIRELPCTLVVRQSCGG